MTAMNSGPVLHAADLPTFVQNHMLQRARGEMSAAAAAGLGGGSSGETVTAPGTRASEAPSLDEVERLAIVEALEHTRGDMVAASYLLGIGRTTLYRKVKSYAIAPELAARKGGFPATGVPSRKGPYCRVSEVPSPLPHGRGSASVVVSEPRASVSGQELSETGSYRISDREKRAILEALEQTKGDMVAAAYLLGIGRTTLYRKLGEYGIKR